jgi:hypothetical protein
VHNVLLTKIQNIQPDLTLLGVIESLQDHKSSQASKVMRGLNVSHFRTLYRDAAILAFSLA